MTSQKPLVSVVMAVFNGENHLSQAIESILSQHYDHFEFIIVDDGSTDRTWEIISHFQETDKRIRPVRLQNNRGVAIAANTGIAIALGKYIARMDSDDISHPDRIATQVSFLEKNSKIGILGSRVRYIDEYGKFLCVPPVIQGDLFIRWHLLFENPFFNSSTMFRKSLLNGNQQVYEETALYGEDYKLWGRLLLSTRGENISDILVDYRIHSSSLSHKTKDIAEREVTYASQIVHQHLPNVAATSDEIVALQRAIKGYPSSAKFQRARLLPVYLTILDEFLVQYKNKEELFALKKDSLSWGTLLILYPFFQSYSLKALYLLTKKDWRSIAYLISKLPYYISRKLVG